MEELKIVLSYKNAYTNTLTNNELGYFLHCVAIGQIKTLFY